jgi:hypothetical protein
MTIALLAVLLLGVALIAIGLAGGDWDIDECAEITTEAMRIDGVLQSAARRGDDNARQDGHAQAARLKACTEPHPRHEPNSGIVRWKTGGRERYNG